MQTNTEHSFKDIHNLLVEKDMRLGPSSQMRENFLSIRSNDLEKNETEITANLRLEMGFLGGLTVEQNDVIRSCLFLMNKTKVLQQLKKINTALAGRAEKLGVYDKTTKKILDTGVPLFDPLKLLSDYVSECAMKNGFEGVVELDHLEPVEAFLDYIKRKLIIRDAIFGDLEEFHGEWTHAFAWLCIMGAIEDQSLFLQSTPVALYAWIGSQNSKIWFNMFERPGMQRDGDMRDFNEFHRTLLDDNAAKELDVLHQLIKLGIQQRAKRGVKRPFEGMKTEKEQVIKNYYKSINSVFGVEYNSDEQIILSENEYKKINYKSSGFNGFFEKKNEIINGKKDYYFRINNSYT